MKVHSRPLPGSALPPSASQELTQGQQQALRLLTARQPQRGRTDPLHSTLRHLQPKTPGAFALPCHCLQPPGGPHPPGAAHFHGDAESWASPPPSVRVPSSRGNPSRPAELITLMQNMGKNRNQLEHLLLMMIISVEGSTANSPGAAGAALEQPLCSRRSRRGRVCRAAKPRGRGTGAKIPSARFHSCEPRGPLTQITERNCSKQISEPRLIKNSTASKKKQNHFFIQMLHSGLVVTAHPLMGRVRLARCQRGGSHGSVRRVALV